MLDEPHPGPGRLTRRDALGSLAALIGSPLAALASAEPADASFRLATFTADVTPPLGHPLMGGGITPAQRIDDPLSANGLVLIGAGLPLALVAVDWCEIRNDAHARWRAAIAEAAGTVPGRVLVASVHQHDTPVADLEAQRILDRHRAAGRICDLDFHERAVLGVARAVRDAIPRARPVTHLGLGQAEVERIASNRRFLTPDGTPQFSRTSATRDPRAREQPEGTIDPQLKTLSFWENDRPLAAISSYATHPMSYYGKGGVSSDFVGLARRRRQASVPDVFQVYVSGCSGNVTAGKYNDGSAANRTLLADRLLKAMDSAWEATRRHPLTRIGFRSIELRLEPRDGPGFTVDDLERRVEEGPRPFDQCLAALGLSWRRRAEAGATLDVPVIDFGVAQLLLLPGESYVEYQLLAQSLRPDGFVIAAGYGECATGYVPTDKAVAEGDTNLRDWCWVAPGAERDMAAAIESALKPSE